MLWLPKKNNTVNICIGHSLFPKSCSQYYDYMLFRHAVKETDKVIRVDPIFDQKEANSLGEFVQLLWLFHNFKKIVQSCEYVRLFHYRRFVARDIIGRQADSPFARVITEREMIYFKKCFSRYSPGELFNTEFDFLFYNKTRVVGDYASSHDVDDIIGFAQYASKNSLMTVDESFDFLLRPTMIPAPSIGIFATNNLIKILEKISIAASYMRDPKFVFRSDYQERNMAFILERYFSHLILKNIETGRSQPNFGYHTVISEDKNISKSSSFNILAAK